MKKITAALCAILLLFAAGCGEKDNGGYSVDIAYFADAGSMPDAAYKVGDAVPAEKEGDENKFFVEDGETSFVSTGDFGYYYNIADESPAFYAVVGFSTCYGFEVGAISIEVTKALDSLGIKYEERAPQNGEIFFLPASENRSVIECKSLKHKLIFVFESNALCAAAVF